MRGIEFFKSANITDCLDKCEIVYEPVYCEYECRPTGVNWLGLSLSLFLPIGIVALFLIIAFYRRNSGHSSNAPLQGPNNDQPNNNEDNNDAYQAPAIP